MAKILIMIALFGISLGHSISAAEGVALRQKEGSFGSPSDRRLKEEITDVSETDALKFLTNSRPVHFKWKTGDMDYNYGFIAQDLLKLGLNDLVKLAPNPDLKETVDSDGLVSPEGFGFTVNYNQLTALLTTAMKSIFTQLPGMNQDIQALKTSIETKDRRIQRLENDTVAMKAFLCSSNPTAIFCH